MRRLSAIAIMVSLTVLPCSAWPGAGPDAERPIVASLGTAQVGLDRHNDYSPWNGGNFIYSTNGDDCSSGVPVHNSVGNHFLVTAAHCQVHLGTSFTNESASIPRGTGNNIGYLAHRDGVTNGLDAELIFTSSSQKVWTGYTFGATATTMTGSAGSPAGVPVCQSGAFEGETCGFNVAWAGCFTFYSWPTWCHLLRADGTNPQAVGEGGSGGPAIRYVTGGLRVIGTVTGISGNLTQCNNWYPQTNRMCGEHVYYTDINAVKNKWGLSVN